MRHSAMPTAIIFFLIFFALDLYAFKAIRQLTASWASVYRNVLFVLYWVVSVGLLGVMTFFMSYGGPPRGIDQGFIHLIMGSIIVVLLPKLIIVITHLMDDAGWLLSKWFNMGKPTLADGEVISRRLFVTKVGVGLAAVPFLGSIYGIVKGRYDFRVLSEQLSFSNLPKAFDGFRIAFISDIHIGSFKKDYAKVEKGLQMVMDQQPDVILFTGDLVNYRSEEAEGWQDVFSQLKAPHGVYSIMGNHDYGDYVSWNSPQDKANDVKRLHEIHKESGFDLLLDENRTITKDGESISLVGVENCGSGSFHSYGDLEKALVGADESFKVLMSHDPSHWDTHVLKSDVDLTLSGHTHGMQFGVEVGGIKWSPVKFRYPRWGGLYKEGKQHLYVNRGFGYIGFPGRVGMPPEITVIDLKKA